MKTKVLQVFYNENGLPFKDQARTVHFPITGSGFQGASNTTQIKFYFGQLGDSSVSWVAVAKLPNGKVGSKVLETYSDSELGEHYALLELNSFYTQYKGDVFISLQGYQGGVNVDYNDDDDLYEIHGTPTIQATGSIKFTNNYATQFVGSGEEENVTLQQIFCELSKYLKINNGIVVISSSLVDISGYDNGQVFYNLSDKHFYRKLDGNLANYDFIQRSQATLSAIVDQLTNINGRVFENYTKEQVTINLYSGWRILYNGDVLDEEHAREYMRYMTGSNYLPKYDYNSPANTYFMDVNGNVYKPQFDDTNGLVLYDMLVIATQNWADGKFVTLATQQTISGKKTFAKDKLEVSNIINTDQQGLVIDLGGDSTHRDEEVGVAYDDEDNEVIIYTSHSDLTLSPDAGVYIGNSDDDRNRVATIGDFVYATNQEVDALFN